MKKKSQNQFLAGIWGISKDLSQNTFCFCCVLRVYVRADVCSDASTCVFLCVEAWGGCQASSITRSHPIEAGSIPEPRAQGFG